MALLSLAICSCAVEVKEETFYTDAGDNGAIISHFYSSDSSVMGKAAWDSVREGMTCMGPQAIGDIKSEIEDLCSKQSCDEATQGRIREIWSHWSSAQSMVKKIPGDQ